jgi:hypothetical protein
MSKFSAMGLAALLAACCAAPLHAADDIPSCYAANRLASPGQPLDRALFVVIDQTTLLDSNLVRDLGRQLQALIVPGTSFQILSFSAYSQGRYLQPLARGVLEQPLTDKAVRDATAVKQLKSLDNCLKSQLNFGTNLVAKAVGQALQGASGELAKSDVVGSLASMSKAVSEAKARTTTVLIISDMLENSSITSFYAQDHMRQIDAAVELQKVRKANVQADFGGAQLYVMGAGIVPEQAGKKATLNYRSTQSLESLRSFWDGFFSQSNGKLVAFGTPALLTPIR